MIDGFEQINQLAAFRQSANHFRPKRVVVGFALDGFHKFVLARDVVGSLANVPGHDLLAYLGNRFRGAGPFVVNDVFGGQLYLLPLRRQFLLNMPLRPRHVLRHR